MTDHNSTSDPVQDERGPHSTRGKSSNHIKPTSEMVSAGVASVTQNMDGIMRGEINMAQLAERCWRAMEDARSVSVEDTVTYDMFRGRIALSELSLIADYVDPAAVCPEMPVSDQVYETCETVKRMAVDLGCIEDIAEKQQTRAITAEEQVKYFERQERHLWKTLWDERDRADLAESKVAELRRVIQEMVELGSDHIDTANEAMVNDMEDT